MLEEKFEKCWRGRKKGVGGKKWTSAEVPESTSSEQIAGVQYMQQRGITKKKKKMSQAHNIVAVLFDRHPAVQRCVGGLSSTHRRQ